MLSIGEFSNICKVSTKPLRYYAEIGLILPAEINPETGYRYYAISQLETMLLINRLKSYSFSLEEIKTALESDVLDDKALYLALTKKKKVMEGQVKDLEKYLTQIEGDLLNIKEGKSIMSYLDNIDIQLIDIPSMNLLSLRKMVHEYEFVEAYGNTFTKLFNKIQKEGLTITGPPMVLFHSNEFSQKGLDTEFAIPIKEWVTGTRDFKPGLSLKTILYGPYSNLTSVYAKQREWADHEGYVSNNALYEVYVTDPSQITDDNDLITEVYYPVKKKALKSK